MLELYWKSNINQPFGRPPGRLNGGVWGEHPPPQESYTYKYIYLPPILVLFMFPGSRPRALGRCRGVVGGAKWGAGGAGPEA
jgi:hypothetical protein